MGGPTRPPLIFLCASKQQLDSLLNVILSGANRVAPRLDGAQSRPHTLQSLHGCL